MAIIIGKRRDLEMKSLDQLHADFPDLFQDIYFECGPGWYDLLNELSQKLTEIIKKHPKIDGCRMYATQVKEKYGGLRFYMSCSTDEMSNIIDEYEKKSLKTCEVCGKPGEFLDVNHWYSVRCQECKP